MRERGARVCKAFTRALGAVLGVPLMLLVGAFVPASAQTITTVMNWDQPGELVALVKTYTFYRTVDNGPLVRIDPICVDLATPDPAVVWTRCSVPVAFSLDYPHDIALTAVSPSTGTTTTVFHYVPGSKPKAAVNFTITFTVSVP